MSEMWKQVSDDERAKYEAKAKKDRERYMDELKTFNKEHPEA